MTAEQFVIWISGYLELSTTLSDREVKIKSALSRLDALDFCYWLSGSFECGGYELTKAETVMKDHLALVFKKVTPDRTNEKTFSDIMLEEFNRQKKSNPFDIYNQPLRKDGLPFSPMDISIC